MNAGQPERDAVSTTQPKPRKPRYAAIVKRVERLTPRMLRITFTGDELVDFGWNGPAAHIKLIFAPEDRGTEPGSEPPRPPMRTYTPRRFDREARELQVDFVLHGDGPASTWAAQAREGQRLSVAGPGRSYRVDPAADWYLLGGDDTAIPAICTILEVLPPAIPAHVLVEVTGTEEEQKLPARANVNVQWLHRGVDPAAAGRPLEAAVRAVEFPSGAIRAYVACEADAMRRIRRHLLQERGLDRAHIVTRGYWRRGEIDHPDRDYGEDV
jgi:NADPH-dependent ferric siderophore reductase